MKAPNFSLPDQNGTMYTLSDFQGKWVVLYFYPRDDTPGCTKEACNFRDTMPEFAKQNVVILGVSKDSIISHKKFIDKHQLNFLLLSDEEKKVIKVYKAWGEKSFMGKKFEGVHRKTYLIDPKGFIKKIYEKVNPLNHTEEIFRDLKTNKILSFLRTYQLMSVATFDKHPWVANVYYAVDDNLNLYFFSDKDTLHCKQIKNNKNVAVAVYDSSQSPAKIKTAFDKIGVQMWGEARQLTNWIEITRGLLLWKKALHITTDKLFTIENMKKAILKGKLYQVTPKKIKMFKQDKQENDFEDVLEF